MNVTAGCRTAFAPLLDPADHVSPVGQPWAGQPFAGSGEPLEALLRFEGALAWEGGVPRGAVPALHWGRDAWLAGWDHADSRFCHAEDEAA